jgi:hypothetical protein
MVNYAGILYLYNLSMRVVTLWCGDSTHSVAHAEQTLKYTYFYWIMA